MIRIVWGPHKTRRVSQAVDELASSFEYNAITVNLINGPANHNYEHVDENAGPSVAFAVGKYEGGKLSLRHADGCHPFDVDGKLIKYDGATPHHDEPLVSVGIPKKIAGQPMSGL